MQTDGRHPYTYAADFIRQSSVDPYDAIGTPCTVSRGQASKIRQAIASALGMTDDDLAVKLSAAFQAAALPIPTPGSKTGPALKSKALRGDRSRASA